MKRTSTYVLHVLLVTLVLAGWVGAQEEKPITWSAEPAHAKPVAPGGTVDIRALAELDPGWHLYSITQPKGGPVATEFKVPSKQPFQLAGAVRQPAPKKAFDQNFGIQTEFFEERAEFTIPVKIAPGTKRGKYEFVAEVHYQVCNDSLCMPPETVKLATVVYVASAAAPGK